MEHLEKFLEFVNSSSSELQIVFGVLTIFAFLGASWLIYKIHPVFDPIIKLFSWTIKLLTTILIGLPRLFYFAQKYGDVEKMLYGKYNFLSMRTCKPPKGIIPRRGLLVLMQLHSTLRQLRLPVFLGVGKTVASISKSETELYQIFILRNFVWNDEQVAILTGNNLNAPDTHTETLEIAKLAMQYWPGKQSNKAGMLMLCTRPHIRRSMLYWQKAKKELGLENFIVDNIGVYVPVWVYFWE